MKFSIIIPVYNVEPYLRECLDSVLSQTCTDWEAICVDDGSTDGSGAILDEFSKRDRRFKVIHQLNSGVGRSRNRALDLALGTWVCFLDGDDVIDDRWLETAYNIGESSDADAIQLKMTVWRGGVRESIEDDSEFRIISKAAILNWGWHEIMENGWVFLYFCRRTMLSHGVRFSPELVICEDAIFHLSWLRFANKVCVGNFKGYFYRQRATSALHSRRRPSDFSAHISALSDLWESYQALTGNEMSLMIQRKISENVISDLCWYLRSSSICFGWVDRSVWLSVFHAWRKRAFSFSSVGKRNALAVFVLLVTGSAGGFTMMKSNAFRQ